MVDLINGRRKLLNLAKINVLLGKNGTGKSTILREFDNTKPALPNLGITRYITPERGGELTYQGNIETTMAQNPTWADDMRRNNRFDNFRQTSVSEFRRLETLVLRKIEKDQETRQNINFTFETTLNLINELLDQIRIVRSDDAGFQIKSKSEESVRQPAQISSGESELISLAIEVLSFAHRAETYAGKTSYLFLDEPDVHLHPDLQQRFVRLLLKAINQKDITVVIATHSTAVLGALNDDRHSHVGFLKAHQTEVTFAPIAESLRRILPIFGAHPLSNVFNKTPILLVEGEDDERIWQQAVRSSHGRICVWPCSAGDIQSLNDYENEVEAIAGSVYDDATAYSLRDRDEEPYEIDDKTIVKRSRLFCRTSENLILSDDVLESLGTNWEKMKVAIDTWIEKYPDHSQCPDMKAFADTNYDRCNGSVKSLRNVFIMLAESNKPWEVAVGQAIAKLPNVRKSDNEHSLHSYLGPKLVALLSLKRTGFNLRPRSRPHPTN